VSRKLIKEKEVLEASSGNPRIALATIAAAKGYEITIMVPESVSIEKRKIIKPYRAELILSLGEKGTGAAIELATTVEKAP
jgi:cysteine synthase